jgi:ABC-type sugar transport system substrate-binding protein
MNKREIIFVGILMFLLGFVVSGGLHEKQTILPDKQRSNRTYAMNVVYRSWPGWGAAKNAINKISNLTPEVQTFFSGPLSGDASAQIEDLEPLLNGKVDGLVLFASDSKALTPLVNNLVAKNIPVVTMFGDVDDSNKLTYISADDRGSARRLTEKVIAQVKEKFEGKGQAKVLLCTGKIGIQPSDQRILGVKDALAAVPWMKLVDVVADENDDAKSVEVISSAWVKNDGFDVIIAVVPRSAIGAIAALKEKQKKAGDVLITGWDSDEDVLRGINDGWIFATSTPKIGYMTQLAISILEAHNIGYLYSDSSMQAKGKNSPLPRRIDIEQTYIDRDNVEAYLAKTLVMLGH